MADSDMPITGFQSETPFGANSLFAVADVHPNSGYASAKHSGSEVGEAMCSTEFTFNDLTTGNKSIFAAINELNTIGAYVTVSGTLTAGSTSITLSDVSITTNSMYDIYTSIYGVNPLTVSVSTGSITITFEEQSSDMTVSVNIKAVQGGGGGASSIESEYKRVDTNGVNTVPYTLYTFTATEDCLLSWVGTCVTDTGSNQGLLYCTLNDTQQGSEINLIRGSENPFSFDLELSSGDVAEIVASWTGSHSNCYFYLRLGEVVAK